MKFSRIDLIGQNGNDGLHYEENNMTETCPSSKIEDDTEYWRRMYFTANRELKLVQAENDKLARRNQTLSAQIDLYYQVVETHGGS